MTTSITPGNVEEVGSLAGMRKRQPEKLPIAYCLSYSIRLTKLDDKLSEDEVLISKYAFDNVKYVAERYYL